MFEGDYVYCFKNQLFRRIQTLVSALYKHNIILFRIVIIDSKNIALSKY